MKVQKPDLFQKFSSILTLLSLFSLCLTPIIWLFFARNIWRWYVMLGFTLALAVPAIWFVTQRIVEQFRADSATRLFYETGNLNYLGKAKIAWNSFIKHVGFPRVTPNSFLLKAWSEAAGIFYQEYVITSNVEDLATALVLIQQAAASTPRDSAELSNRLNKLGVCLRAWYQYSGELSALDRSVDVLQESLSLNSTDVEEIAKSLSDLGVSLIQRYRKLGQTIDLANAAQNSEKAAELLPTDSTWSGYVWHNVGSVLFIKYNSTGILDDINRAIAALEKLNSQTVSISADLVAARGELGSALITRYNHNGQLTDLHAGIRVLQDSLDGTVEGSINKVLHYGNLGMGQLLLYRRTKDIYDLNDGIANLRMAVERCLDGSTDKSQFTVNLSSGLYQRYAALEDPADLREGTELLQPLFQTSPAESVSQNALIANLGIGSIYQFSETQNPNDLNNAMEFLRLAISTCPEGSPLRSQLFLNIGLVQQIKWESSNDFEDLQACISYYRESCSRGILNSQESALMGSLRWGNWALKRESWSEAIEAFTYGRQIIEQLLKVQLLRQNKHTWIEEAFGLFSGLAYALARGGHLKETVVALEHGRARLLSESLQFGRRDLEHLPLLGYEELYFRFSELKDKYSAISQADEDDSNIITEQTDHLAGIFAELQKIIASIQCVPGYEDFFALPDLRQIQSFAAEMPIVYLVTTEAGALGMVVTQESIREVWSDLTNSNVIEWLNQQNEDPVSEGYIAGQFGNTALLNSSLENILPKLGQGFIEKIAAEIRSMGLKEFTLIPSGWLGLFPLHAATYTYKGQVICLLDEFIVHYSPSAQALRAARAFLSSKDESRKELVGVGNPLPNPRPLIYGQAELEEIEVMFNGNSKTVYREKATKEDFLKMLPSATHVHFSCHGRFNSGIPLYSSLLLAKHDVLTLDEILTQFVFTNTRLVTLSACQTAITDFKKLIDESIGFPAGFMEAGIPGVIGTLWSIDDLSTAFLMLRFYELHIKDGRSPAESLRSAQLWLRDLTNDEMSDFLKNYYLDDQPSEGRTMFGIARNEFRKYVTPLGNLKPFEKPVYWAAFVFYGL